MLGVREAASLDLTSAIRAALAYADVFDWPLTAAEIHRTLPVRASLADVRAGLEDRPAGGPVHQHGGLYLLGDRPELVDRRVRLARTSVALWRRAARWGRVVGALPHVRMVAVSGSLAAHAADRDDDVDLFVVTADGRLWTARAMTLATGRVAGRRRNPLCPNFLLAESALGLDERDRYSAHELLQVVPLAGAGTYTALLRANPWVHDLFPNHPGADLTGVPVARRSSRARTAMGDRVERWEMERKRRMLAAAHTGPEVRYDEVACKGHVEQHRARILAAYHERLVRLGIEP